jgi:hypothetical protein
LCAFPSSREPTPPPVFEAAFEAVAKDFELVFAGLLVTLAAAALSLVLATTAESNSLTACRCGGSSLLDAVLEIIFSVAAAAVIFFLDCPEVLQTLSNCGATTAPLLLAVAVQIGLAQFREHLIAWAVKMLW